MHQFLNQHDQSIRLTFIYRYTFRCFRLSNRLFDDSQILYRFSNPSQLNPKSLLFNRFSSRYSCVVSQIHIPYRLSNRYSLSIPKSIPKSIFFNRFSNRYSTVESQFDNPFLIDSQIDIPPFIDSQINISHRSSNRYSSSILKSIYLNIF